MATKTNTEQETLITGTSSADSILNHGYAVTISTGSGDDTVHNDWNNEYSFESAENVSINTGAGNDSVYNDNGWYCTINTGDGNDIVDNYNGEKVSINTGAGHDLVYNRGNNSSLSAINVGAGSDTVYNYSSKVTIKAGDGNDRIYNYKGGSLSAISGGDGNDYIDSAGEKVTINSGTGNDSIKNYGNKVTISGGTGNDTIINNCDISLTPYDDSDGSNVLFKYTEGDGKDVIYGFKENSTLSIAGSSYSSKKSGDDVIFTVGDGKITLVGAADLDTVNFKFKEIIDDKTLKSSADGTSLIGGNGKDSLYISHDNVTASGGDGKDTIYSSGYTPKIFGNAGNDSIYIYFGSRNTVNSGTGNDTIFDYGGWHDSINADSGNDLISLKSDSSWAYSHTIRGGKGNDKIYSNSLASNSNGGSTFQFSEGDGNDTIYGFTSYDEISLGGGYYTRATVGNDVIVSLVSGGTITLKKAGNKTISIVGGTLIGVPTSDNDYITNTYNNVTIDALGGNDYISNSASSVTIYGGAGNDSVWNEPKGDKVMISGGKGNDSIKNYGNNVTISGGTGNDTIINNCDSLLTQFDDGDGSNVLFKYTEGDGKDVIYGFKENSTLSIAGSSYSSKKSGDDVIFTVGEGKITLIGAANLGSSLNFKFKPLSDDVTIKSSASGTSLIGGTGNDSIYISHANVTAIGGTGNDTVYNYNGDKSSINAGDGADSIHAYDNDTVTVYAGAGNDTVTGGYYHSKIYGGTGNDKISITGSSYSNTVDGGDDSDTITAYGGSLNGGAGNDRINVTSDKSTVKGGKGNDTVSLYSGSYSDLIQYSSGDGNDVVYNFQSANDTLKIGNGTSDTYYSVKSGSDIVVSVGSGAVTLKGVSSANIAGTHKDPKLISLTSGADNYTNSIEGATIQALGGNDTITNTGHHTTIYGGAGKDSIINDNRGAALSLAGSYSYIDAGKDDDYILNYDYADNSFINGGEGNDTILNRAAGSTIYGDTGNDSIRNVTGEVSINGGDGNDFIVDVGFISGINNNNTILGGIGNDTISLSSSGHDNFIQYNLGDGKDVIYNFNSTSTLKIGNGTTDTYSKTKSGDNVIITVGKGKITLKGAATLSTLNIKGKEIVPDENKWTIDGTTAKYGTSSKTLVTVKGVKSIDGLSLIGNVVTVTASSLNKKKVTVSDGYTLALADDVQTPTPKEAAWYFDSSSSTATYKGPYKTAGYKLASNAKSISYSKETTAETLASVEGAKAKPTISNGVIKLKTSTINSKVTLSGNYEFDFASGNYQKAKVLGSSSADKITSHGKNISLNGGADNDTIKVCGSATSVKGGAGADVFVFDGGSGVITDYAAEDKISIASGTVNATTSGDNVIFTVGSKKITVKGGKDKTITYIENGATKTYSSDDDIGVTITGNTASLTADYGKDTYSIENTTLRAIDASAAERSLMLTGNSYANTISGSKHKDTIIGGGTGDLLYGGDGNDYIDGGSDNDTLCGGAGNDSLIGGDDSDTFVYSVGDGNGVGDGNDTIFGYTKEDKIKIDGGTANISTKNGNVIFKVGTGANKGTITVKDGEKKIIAYSDKSGSDLYYYKKVKVDGENGTATLLNTYSAESLKATDFDAITEVTTIDASAVHSGLRITGSGKNESIIGGYGNDTIIGGTGKDSLTGGTGKDYFRYESGDGNDVIEDYSPEDNDVIQIMSGQVSEDVVVDGYDVIFSVENGSIRVKNGKGNYITFVDEDDKVMTNISGTYTKSTMQDATWFTEDDTNFNTSQLDLIVKTTSAAYSLGELDTSTPLATDKTLITYTDKK